MDDLLLRLLREAMDAHYEHYCIVTFHTLPEQGFGAQASRETCVCAGEIFLEGEQRVFVLLSDKAGAYYLAQVVPVQGAVFFSVIGRTNDQETYDQAAERFFEFLQAQGLAPVRRMRLERRGRDEAVIVDRRKSRTTER